MNNQNEALFDAIKANAYDEVKSLITAGADANALDNEGRTPLMVAIRQSPWIVEELLNVGVDINARDNKGRTPLMYGLPFSRGWPGSSNGVFVFLVWGFYHIHLMRLLKDGADVNTQDHDGKTSLMYATTAGAMKMLIEAGADVNARDNTGETPLMYVVDAEAAKELVEAGANINARDNDGQTPLIHAVRGWKSEAIRSLNAADELGPWGVIVAENWQLDTVKFLLQAGAETNAADHAGKTALMHARDTEVVKALLASGADANAKDNSGRTALLDAGNIESMKALIAAGADVNARDNEGRTSLMHGLSVYRPSDFKPNPAVIALALLLCFDRERLNLLLKAGADVNARDNEGKTPLMYAKDAEAVEILLQTGSEINAVDHAGKTALDYARMQGNPEIAEVLTRIR